MHFILMIISVVSFIRLFQLIYVTKYGFRTKLEFQNFLESQRSVGDVLPNDVPGPEANVGYIKTKYKTK